MSETTELLQYAETAALSPGDRVRSKQHPELTGRIRCYEWNRPGVLSAIPYNVAWDNPSLAYDLRGTFAIYASDHGLEKMDEVTA